MFRVICLMTIQRSIQALQPSRNSVVRGVLNSSSLMKTSMMHSTPTSIFHHSSQNFHNEVNDTATSALGKVTPKMRLFFTCKKCNTRNDKSFTKHAYTKGIVIVRCDGCDSLHLIADNLDWFKNSKGKNIEEILASKGEKVNRTPGSVLEFEQSSDNS